MIVLAMAEDPASLEARIASALDRRAPAEAATEAVRGYGPQILGYLRALLRDEGAADEAFSQFSEDLWKGIEHFRGESSFKTWSYAVAWNAARRVLRDPYRRRKERLRTSRAIRIADQVRSLSSAYGAHAAIDRLAKLRQRLAPDEQTLLILRFDRDLTWKEIAEVLSIEEPSVRKRFERLSAKLRKLAESEGLLDALPPTRSRGSH
jgi:RNA polymerase sigma-70 factor, ECF subfamily